MNLARFLFLPLTFVVVVAAQERPEVLRVTDADIKLSLAALSAPRPHWPKQPEHAPATKPEAIPAGKLSPEEANVLVEALKQLTPTGKLIWNADLKMYVPEFRVEPVAVTKH